MLLCFLFKQKTAYDCRICDWSSDVCSSDLIEACAAFEQATTRMLGFEAACLIVATLCGRLQATFDRRADALFVLVQRTEPVADVRRHLLGRRGRGRRAQVGGKIGDRHIDRSEEHTSELQSLMRISYAVICLKKHNTHTQ